MANVNDVAAYIIDKLGGMSAMKLQKLVYYSQAWHMVWEEQQLFDDRIEAWANGPVVYALYRQHRGKFFIDGWTGDKDALGDEERSSIDAVLDSYGRFTAQQLSEMTHKEEPWKRARRGLGDGERSDALIKTGWMHEYYHGLAPNSELAG